jgi:hypothetical protein
MFTFLQYTGQHLIEKEEILQQELGAKITAACNVDPHETITVKQLHYFLERIACWKHPHC